MELKFVSPIKDLGTLFNKNLDFYIVIKIIIEATGTKLLKYTSFKFKSTKPFICIYNSTVKSKLMYGSEVWHPKN